MVVDTDNRAVIAHYVGFTALLFCVLVWYEQEQEQAENRIKWESVKLIFETK